MIYRYCTSLSKDQLLDFKEEYTMEENNFYKFKLTLPINSVIKTIKIDVNILIFFISYLRLVPIIINFMFIILFVQGISCAIKRDAKKSAAFNACIKLYKIGILDEHLMPKSVENIVQNYLKKWFPHWRHREIEHSKCQLNLEAPELKKRRRVHFKVSDCINYSYYKLSGTYMFGYLNWLQIF